MTYLHFRREESFLCHHILEMECLALLPASSLPPSFCLERDTPPSPSHMPPEGLPGTVPCIMVTLGTGSLPPLRLTSGNRRRAEKLHFPAKAGCLAEALRRTEEEEHGILEAGDKKRNIMYLCQRRKRQSDLSLFLTHTIGFICATPHLPIGLPKCWHFPTAASSPSGIWEERRPYHHSYYYFDLLIFHLPWQHLGRHAKGEPP